VAATRAKPPAVRALREFRSKFWGTISAKIEAVAVVLKRKSARVLYLLNILSDLLLMIGGCERNKLRNRERGERLK
jgi:hypothetical protein